MHTRKDSTNPDNGAAGNGNDLEMGKAQPAANLTLSNFHDGDEMSDINDIQSDGGASWVGRVFDRGQRQDHNHGGRRHNPVRGLGRQNSSRRNRKKGNGMFGRQPRHNAEGQQADLVDMVESVDAYGQIQPEINSHTRRQTLISHVSLMDFFSYNRNNNRQVRSGGFERQASSLSSHLRDQQPSCRRKSDRFRRSFELQGDHFSQTTAHATKMQQHILDAAGISRNSFEARSVAILRWTVIIVWLTAACIISLLLVKEYAEGKEEDEFRFQFKANADKLVSSFRASTDTKLNAINALSTYITVFAQETNSEFPFVTLPGFVMGAANTRISTESPLIDWLPLVKEEQRERWEEYAYKNRFQANRDYKLDAFFRTKQDIELGYLDAKEGAKELAKYEGYNDDVYVNPPLENVTVVNNTVIDGTFYHPKIWAYRNGGAAKETGTGPSLPLWQRAPVSSRRQAVLNVDAATAPTRVGILPYLFNQKKRGVLLHRSVIPILQGANLPNQTAPISQFRHDDDVYTGDPVATMSYPVFDDYGTGNLIGVLSIVLYWRLLFIDILPSNAKGYICVLENNFNQTLAYRVDGDQARFIGEFDPGAIDRLDYIFHDMVVTSQLGKDDRPNARPKAETQAYTTLPIDEDFNTYTIRIYPTKDTLDVYKTDEPIFYTCLVASIFAVAAMVFLAYDFCVQKRQQLIASKAIENAQKAAAAERDLNEYIAHEVRNPLSAALSACSFVDSAVNESRPLSDDESKQLVREDVQIINSSLTFVNELLRNLLDLHRATDRQIRIRKRQTAVFDEVLKPVASILYRRDAGFELIVECCPRHLRVSTDGLRLKQVLLNLGRNASKFVKSGFLRLRAEVEGVDGADGVDGVDGGSGHGGGTIGTTRFNDIDNMNMNTNLDVNVNANMNMDSTMDGRGKSGRSVKIYVEDSGPGIPIEDRQHLFSKFKETLDVATQGAGIGLCLCKNLIDIMGGDIWLDESYDSGIPGQPGTRFVIDLRETPSAPLHDRSTNSMQLGVVGGGHGSRHGSRHGENGSVDPGGSAVSQSTPSTETEEGEDIGCVPIHQCKPTTTTTTTTMTTATTAAISTKTVGSNQRTGERGNWKYNMSDKGCLDSSRTSAGQDSYSDADRHSIVLTSASTCGILEAGSMHIHGQQQLHRSSSPSISSIAEDVAPSNSAARTRRVSAPAPFSTNDQIDSGDPLVSSPTDDDGDDRFKKARERRMTVQSAFAVDNRISTARVDNADNIDNAGNIDNRVGGTSAVSAAGDESESNGSNNRDTASIQSDHADRAIGVDAKATPATFPSPRKSLSSTELVQSTLLGNPLPLSPFSSRSPDARASASNQETMTLPPASLPLPPPPLPLFPVELQPLTEVENNADTTTTTTNNNNSSGMGDKSKGSPSDGHTRTSEATGTGKTTTPTAPTRKSSGKPHSNPDSSTMIASVPPAPTAAVATAAATPATATTTTTANADLPSMSETQDKRLPEVLSVLFVDDDKVLRKLFGRCIKRAFPNWSVKEAPDGETAIDMVSTQGDSGKSFDLIFMDQYMSTTEKRMLGTETVEELRKRGVKSRICGLSANDVGTEFSAVGADAFICKPLSFNKKELEKQIEWIMS